VAHIYEKKCISAFLGVYNSHERRRKGMKARKVAAVKRFAVPVVFGFLTFTQQGAYARASEGKSEVVLSVQSVAAEADGSFSAEVCLDKLPETGLCALEFAIAYDAAALRITEAELLYDTGAQEAEALIHPNLKVFSYKNDKGFLQIQWATALEIPDYWLSEERALVRLHGETTDALNPGESCGLRIEPVNVILEDGTEKPGEQITAGYLDAEGNAYRYDVEQKNGAVWQPDTETGVTMYGDLNLDGQCTIEDAVMLMKVIAEEGDLCAAAYANADCETDDMLTMADVTLMLQVLSNEQEASVFGAH